MRFCHAMLSHLILGLLALGFVAMGIPSTVFAHAIILSSTPVLDSAVAGSDVPVELQFNSRIDHAHSRLTLIKPDASTLDLVLSPETKPEIISSHVAGLAPGAYRLRWQVLSLDGHITRGDITFSVK